MIDPVFTATLTAKSLSELAKGELINVAQNLINRATKAKEKHIAAHTDTSDPIEEIRDECLGKVCDLQHEVILSVSDASFLKNTLPLLLEHIGTIYEAESIRELRIIDMSLSRIHNALVSYQNEKARRKRIRMWAVIVSIFNLVALSLFLWIGPGYFGIKNTDTINIISIPVPVLVWSIVGSFAAILYRFTNAGDNELNEPLRWLFARPLIGIIMGVISFLILKVGLITIEGQESASSINNNAVVSLIAFLAGFSDRFSETLLKTIVGKFGGDKEGELVSMEVRTTSTKTESSEKVYNDVGKIIQKDAEEDLTKKLALSEQDNMTDKLDAPNTSSKESATQTQTVDTSTIINPN